MKLLLTIGILLITLSGLAQSEPSNGLKESTPAYYALKNATIYVSPNQKISNGTLLIKNDNIESIGMSGLVIIPKEAVVIDCKGKVILPAFIELNSNVGIAKAVAPKTKKRDGAFYWNHAIHPEYVASETYVFNDKASTTLIEKGFGFALTHQKDGIARGEGAFVSLGAGIESYLSSLTTSSFFSFQKGVSIQRYPSSQMGSIALLRQTFYDAHWYKSNQDNLNLSLAAINEQLNSPMFLETRDKLEVLRAQKIGDEFEIKFNFLGSGNEYEIIDQLAMTKPMVVLPLNFPAAYDVKNPYVARQIPLSDLKHWEMAPMNASILVNRDVPICLSGNGVKTKDFWTNLRKCIESGLTPEQALDALTMSPAKLLGVDDKLGSLAKGKLASFIIYDANPLDTKAQILESWLLGKRKVHNPSPAKTTLIGKYNISFSGKKYPIEIKEKGKKYSGEVTYRHMKKGASVDTTVNLFIDYANNDITLQFNIRNEDLNGSVSLRGKVISRMGIFEGEGLLPNGDWVQWTGIRSKKGKATKEKVKHLSVGDTTSQTWYPNLAYGFKSLPEQESVIIKNATLWTNEESGVIEDAHIIIKEGKIIFVGRGNYPTPLGARVIDARGKHVTAGIIDEHSHIAISKGVNEGGQAVSAEVSIGHVVNQKDINIYRQLSGGVTASQLLHGSANPIGGQSALIKLKWGFTAEEMLIEGADPFIKFALGENVKHSRWTSSTRFPHTRMGVEQVFYEAFNRATAYAKEWKDFKDGVISVEPRKDLELEVLNEIMASEHFITCHSYVQSEINMLMHVADSLGFKINTFTHILEGYKLADKMVEHGVGGSTFSDWWAYKHEVNDAIPYNAAIMNEQGVVVAINSDDTEMGRRLNQEAAKAVKYGGMSEEDALKMVTLNPAKLLHLDDRMGSLKVGKDADVVVWSDHPLSILAKVEQTIIDGIVMYDIERDREMRRRNQAEKARIISMMLDDNNSGGKKRTFFKKKMGHFHCDTIGEEESTEENHH
ncbi:MAG: amidohydrolase family protein [Crocinitomicaceae bacterium]|nr:amidohydrolase family protein [Crocinitomicaceae bacterium]